MKHKIRLNRYDDYLPGIHQVGMHSSVYLPLICVPAYVCVYGVCVCVCVCVCLCVCV